MSFHHKNVTVTLAIFSFILLFFALRSTQLIANNEFNQSNVVQLWAIVVILAIFATLAGIIFAHGVSLAKNRQRLDEVEDLVDERDLRIDREGTHLTYRLTSISTFIAMLLFAVGQSPLIMFSLLIVSGLIGQIAGDMRRLYLYRQG
ncbi:MAG: hypothetical protein ACPG8W_10345 [Candidatus Promineifilaceae bacterium]